MKPQQSPQEKLRAALKDIELTDAHLPEIYRLFTDYAEEELRDWFIKNRHNYSWREEAEPAIKAKAQNIFDGIFPDKALFETKPLWQRKVNGEGLPALACCDWELFVRGPLAHQLRCAGNGLAELIIKRLGDLGAALALNYPRRVSVLGNESNGESKTEPVAQAFHVNGASKEGPHDDKLDLKHPNKGNAALINGKVAVSFKTAESYLGITSRHRQQLMKSEKLGCVGKGQNRRITAASLLSYLPPLQSPH